MNTNFYGIKSNLVLSMIAQGNDSVSFRPSSSEFLKIKFISIIEWPLSISEGGWFYSKEGVGEGGFTMQQINQKKARKEIGKLPERGDPVKG